jgi:hypothetical protein
MRDYEVPYVTRTWLRSYRSAAPVRHVPRDIYYANHQVLVGELLRNHPAWVAVDPQSDLILGFASWAPLVDRDVVHFTAARSVVRGHGIAQAFARHFRWGDRPLVVSHETGAWRAFCKDRPYEFNPYLAHGSTPRVWNGAEVETDFAP